MRGPGPIIVLLVPGLAAACGRIGFEPRPDPQAVDGGVGASAGSLEAECFSSGGTWGTAQVSSGACDWTITAPGTYAWVVPFGVTRVSVVCVGGGGGAQNANGGGGGGVGWINGLDVTPGQVVPVVVGAGAPRDTLVAGGDSWVLSPDTVLGGGGRPNIRWGTTPVPDAGAGGIHVGDGGGDGGSGDVDPGGGGAGGYTGNGGASQGGAGSGGGGGGGLYTSDGGGMGGGGGGVGLYGEAASGAAQTAPGAGGNAGSDGGAGGSAASSGGGTGGRFGGGAGGGGGPGGGSGGGACRIVWPGDVRQFPATLVGPA